MASEKRLIDANAFWNRLRQVVYDIAENDDFGRLQLGYSPDIIEVVLKQTPTMDAVVLPCKIGDTVWGIRYHTGVPYIKQGTVSEMAYLEDMRLAIAVKFAPKYNTRGFWGVTIFATREECEAALGGKDNG